MIVNTNGIIKLTKVKVTEKIDSEIDQELISVRALVFDLAQLTFQKRFDCRNAIIRSSETFLDTS